MRRAIRTAFLSTILLAPPAQAQPTAEAAPDDLTVQVAKLNATLEQLVELTRQQVENQTLDLLMQRIQLSADQVGQIERDLRAAQKQRQSYGDEKSQLEDRMKLFEDELQRGQLEEAQMDALTEQLESAMERLETRLRSADREIAELEASLGRQRQDLREWQEFVDDRLGDL